MYKTNGQDEVLTSFPFNIYVSPASFNAGNITSSNEFTELSDIIKNIDTINQNVESSKDSAKNAELSANQAAASAANASESANQADLSAAEALSSSALSKSWAIGETGIREGEDTDNSKYYSQLSSDHMDTAKSYMDAAETYSNLTETFKDDIGYIYPAGTNVYYTADSLASGVTGVKGKAESAYRTGNVNLTPANIGLGNVTNVAQMPASYWHWSGQDGQPSWIWGGNDSNNYYVYNPSKFKVSYANSAGNSTKIDSSLGNYVKFGNMWIKGEGDQQLELGSYTETDYKIILGVYDGSWTVCPKKTQFYNFGTANHRWGNVYVNYLSYNTMGQTSDQRKKQNIISIDDRFQDFLMDLNPVFYRYIDDPQHLRTGLIAQDVEKKMEKYNIPKDYQLLN